MNKEGYKKDNNSLRRNKKRRKRVMNGDDVRDVMFVERNDYTNEKNRMEVEKECENEMRRKERGEREGVKRE